MPDVAQATAPAAPSATASPSPAPRTREQQLIDLINGERAKAGCRGLRIDHRIHAAAQLHSEDMAAHDYYDHADRQGRHAGDRITAAGYAWRLWGENLDRDRTAPTAVLRDWLDGAIHQENILDCRFTVVGVGVAPASGSLLWTLDLAEPSGR